MAIPNKTYKNLVDTLKALGTHHRQIHTGWVFQLPITVENDFQSCDIPMDNTYIGQ
jgi:hypothetical protein